MMTPGVLIALISLFPAVILVIIKQFFNQQNRKQEIRDKAIVERNTEIGKARDDAQEAFELQIEAALDMTNDLVVAVQTGQTNGFITDSKNKFDKAVERAKQKKVKANSELKKAYSKEIV